LTWTRRDAHILYTLASILPFAPLSPKSQFFEDGKARRCLNDVFDLDTTSRAGLSNRNPCPEFSPQPLTSRPSALHIKHPTLKPKMEKSQAEDYLTSLLNKTLRVTTTDTRMFLGQFKCTDSVPFPSSFPSSLVPPPCFHLFPFF